MAAFLKIPIPSSAGLVLSYRCTAACRHCMYACSPEWDGDWITESDLGHLLSSIAPYIEPAPYGANWVGLNSGLHFTGGEPFLNFDLLCSAVSMAAEMGIPSTFVETNCFWCVNDRVTRDKMRLLREKGLRGIMVSINPYYLEYVPFENTSRAVGIGREVFGGNLMLYQTEYFNVFSQMGIKGRMKLETYLQREKKEQFYKNVEFFFNGRAPYSLGPEMEDVFPRAGADCFFRVECRPAFVRSWHNHFDNYGNYMPGYCGGLSYGDWHDLEGLLASEVRKEEYPVLAFLMGRDMEGLFRFARDRGYEEPPEGYFSKCHLCVDIRRYLVLVERFKELVPLTFYEQLTR